MRSILSLALFILIGTACATPPSSLPAPLRAGAARVDITPKVGSRSVGGYREVISVGIHDPLHVRALVLEQGEERMAIALADVCGVSREVSDPARRKASARTGIPVERIVLAATHNHGGAEFNGVLWDVWREKTIRKHGKDIHAPEDYARRLIDATATAITDAAERLTEVRIQTAIPKLPGIAFNRRFHMKNGTVRFNPGRLNPDIVRVAGPVDEDFPLVFFRNRRTGNPVASLSSFAIHTAVFGGREFGSDFPGRLDEALQKEFGPDFVSVFAEGAAGDINHIDVSRKATMSSTEHSAHIGRAMTKAALEAIPALKPDVSALGVRSTRVLVPVRAVSDSEIRKARKTVEDLETRRASFDALVGAFRTLWTERIRVRDGDAAREEVQVFRLGRETAVVCLPHEIFVELGMEIRRRSPFDVTLIVSLANDIDFYVPTRKAFTEGSYEVSTSPYLPGGGELLVEEAVRLLTDLDADARRP